jgi:ActR/RegA family two-component response regulator
VSAASENVLPLRPIRVLLVSDDDRFADRLLAAAARRGLQLDRAAARDDLDRRAKRDQPDVIALDARRARRRTARAASALASLNPRIAVVLVAVGVPTSTMSGLRLVDKALPPDRLLEELEHAYLGLAPEAGSRV